MRRPKRLQLVMSLLATAGLVFPPGAMAADRHVPTRLPAPAPAVVEAMPVAIDIQMQSGGLLAGQTLNQTGQAMADSQVLVLQQGNVIAKTRTDATGRFAVRGLTGGVYEVRGEQSSILCRLWAPQTAPPSAKSELLLASDSDLVRGQSGYNRRRGSILKGPLPWMVAVAAIIAVPTALALNLKPGVPAPPSS